MPARVGNCPDGTYSVEHSIDGDTFFEGQILVESTGFGPLCFQTRERADMVVSAINAELEDRGTIPEITERSFSVDEIKRRLEGG